VLPSIAAPENSFTQRLAVAAEAKMRLAETAFALLRGGETIFLDSSSTAYFLAVRIAASELALRVITNSGPSMQALAAGEDPRVEVFAAGGALRRLTGSYVGPTAVRTIREHFADTLFFSVAGVAPNGMLTDADDLEAAVKRAMLAQAQESVLLLDDSKLTTRGRQAVAPVQEVSLVLADGIDASAAEAFRTRGVTVRTVEAGQRFVRASSSR
jgi:DeoR/GlpR family transcriptional regulator of sugar metabolism